MYIDMNSPGSIPDSTAFQRSSFCKKILAGCLPNYSFMYILTGRYLYGQREMTMFSMLIRLVLTGLLEGYSWCWRRSQWKQRRGASTSICRHPCTRGFHRPESSPRSLKVDRSRRGFTDRRSTLSIYIQIHQTSVPNQHFRCSHFYLSNFIAKHAPDMPVAS